MILKIIAIIFGIIELVSAFTIVLIVTHISKTDVRNNSTSSPMDTKLNNNKD